MKGFTVFLLISCLTVHRASAQFLLKDFADFDEGHPDDFDDHPTDDFEEEESFTEDDEDADDDDQDDKNEEHMAEFDYDYDSDLDMDAYDSETALDIFKRYISKRATADKDFIQTAFDLSNKYRAKHGAPLFTLDDKLNEEAQAYADEESKTNVQKHSCGPCDKYGENLAFKASTGDIPTGVEAAKWAVNSWYDEVSLYPFDNPGGGDMHKWGHFTALVWKASTKMGIGVAYGTKTSKKGNKMKTVYVVARYLPPGNMLTPEAMKENVLPAQ